MAKEFSRAFYHSAAWQSCRSSYIRKAGGLCEDCLERGEITPGVEVHHVIELTLDNIGDPRIALNHDNLRLLCHDCHSKRHHGEREPRRYIVDQATGNVISPPGPVFND